jgi:hypothetical protein
MCRSRFPLDLIIGLCGVIVFLVAIFIFGKPLNDSSLSAVKDLIPTYITLMTAFIAVVIAAIALNPKVLRRGLLRIEVTLAIPFVGILWSIAGLYWYYFFSPYLLGIQVCFYFATIFLVCTIYTSMSMAVKILKSTIR